MISSKPKRYFNCKRLNGSENETLRMNDDSTISQRPVSFTSVGMSSSSGSFGSVRSSKYNGLIDVSFKKTIRNDLYQMFCYVYSEGPRLMWLHYIMNALRIIQLIGPAMCPSIKSLWPDGDIATTTISYVAIIYNLLPPDLISEYCIYFLIAYCVVKFLIIGLFIYAATAFKKNAMLPTAVTYIITIYMASFGHYLHAIALRSACVELSLLIFNRNNMNIPFPAVMIVLTVILTLIFFYIYIEIASRSLYMLPNSFQSLNPIPHNFVFFVNSCVAAILGFASPSPKIVQIVGCAIAALVYISLIFAPFLHGGFSNWNISSMIIAAGISGFITAGFAVVSLCVNASFGLIHIFGLVILYAITFYIARTVFMFIQGKNINLLDIFLEENSDLGEIFRSPNKFENAVIAGMHIAHPSVVDSTIFKSAIEVWNTNPHIWFIFAKYISIYPEETQLLAWIYQSVITLKIRHSEITSLKAQAVSISRARESNLSADLKTKIAKISKQVQGTRHKLRNVWDAAIQGNIGQIEPSSRAAIKAVNKNHADYKHLLRQFPNNRFVTRAYSRFLLEICGFRDEARMWEEKTRVLQRGMTINADEGHELGLLAFSQLPDRLMSAGRKDTQSYQGMVSDPAALSAPEMESDEQETVGERNEQYSILKSTIETFPIPAIKHTLLVRIAALLIVLAIGIGFAVWLPTYYTSLGDALPYLYHLSFIRTSIFQVATFSNQYIFEGLGLYTPTKSTGDNPPQSMGGKWAIKDQLIYLMGIATAEAEAISEYRDFMSGDKYCDLAREMVFSTIINYTMYRTPTDFTTEMMNVPAGLLESIVQLAEVIHADYKFDPNDKFIVNTSAVLNPVKNCGTLVAYVNSGLTYIIQYLQETQKNMDMIIIIAVAVISIVVSAASIGSMVYQVHILRGCKEEVYRCLTALPKNIVSQITENMRVIKKTSNGTDQSTEANSEVSKQEDNVLKVFHSANNGSAQVNDMLVLIMGTILFILFSVVMFVIFYLMTSEELEFMVNNAPHLNYVQGAYAMLLGAYLSISVMTLDDTDGRIPIFSVNDLKMRFDSRSSISTDYYHKARFGGEKLVEFPFSDFPEFLSDANSKYTCPDPTFETSTFYEAALCFSTDHIFSLLGSTLESRIAPMVDFNQGIDSTDVTFSNIFDLLSFPIYDLLILPMHEAIITSINEDMTKLKQNYLAWVYIILIILVLIEVAAMMQVFAIRDHAHGVLMLLLHCQPNVVFGTPKIVSVLSGDFSNGRSDMANRDSQFFSSLLDNLPDAIITFNADGKIDEVNTAFTRMFATDKETIQSTDIHTFLNTTPFQGNTHALLTESTEVNLMIKKQDGDDIHLAAISSNAGQRSVISFRDVTQTVRYNLLIANERAKSDQLLASILPESLVKRVQAGENNISFAVQSATILFLDIVEFTPWCGSNEAAFVMATLNDLFKRLDAALTKYPTMTKIKCIGDCYMCAGGIFSDINQPVQHSKEVVSFGLDAINIIEELNKDRGQKLRIRVGVNTGGPIVAGVLGCGKPTFEILGPAINMAQQMEHHGVPMQVHVSRSVYELIYGDSFSIKERGAIEVKGGSAITYLVTRK